jgi:hypothetical protein
LKAFRYHHSKHGPTIHQASSGVTLHFSF